MDYSLRATRKHPKLVVLMVDESTSMGELYAGKRKHVWVDERINDAIRNLVYLCDSTDGVRNWVHLMVMGYGGRDRNKPRVRSLLREQTPWVVPISDVADSSIAIRDKEAIYVASEPNGWTPMATCLKTVGSIVKDWIEQHPESPAPVIMNVTDGVPTDDEHEDGPVERWANQVSELRTEDGAALLINSGVPSMDRRMDRCVFPNAADVPDIANIRRLWQMASPLPAALVSNAISAGLLPSGASHDGRRMYVNASDPADLQKLFEFGTQLNPNEPH